MKEVIIRTHFNEKVGLGHLFRTKNLLKKFEKKNYKITFALDNEIKNKRLLNFNYFFLYSKKKKFTSQSEDAVILKKKIEKKNIKYIIVDDYRFDKTWEQHFYNKGQKIIVFEDINNRKHLCDIIIDSRSTDKETLERNYKNLVPKKCKKLLGPKYSIINPNIKKKIKIKKLNLLFYFGGGGDFENFKKLILNFSSTVQKDDLKNKIIVNIVVGPLAKNYKFLKLLSKKNKFIKIIYNKLDLSFILQKTSFFFGTASSIVNELNYLNIPSCLFSVSDNQNQNLKYKENFGQFLHLNKKEALNTKRMAELLLVLVKNIKRVKNLSNQKTLTVDKYGSQRIFKEIKKFNINIKNKKKVKKQTHKQKDGLFPVSDKLINEYLESRNLNQNRKNSINTNLINKVDHYIWWFTTKRKSFYLQREGKIRLFISQELMTFKKNFFWVGGWFNSKSKCTVLDIMKALKWQIAYSKKISKSPWIVLIKKSNQIVFKINQYLGYKIISQENDKMKYQAIKNFYKIRNSNNYLFLKK